MSYDDFMRIARPLMISMAITSLTATAAFAVPPSSGTARQIANAVAISPKISKVTPKVLAAIPYSTYDWGKKLFPPRTNLGCATTTQCVFGSKQSKMTVVLFGDSHASMWVPALAPIARANHFKLIVIWLATCHVADVNVQYEPFGFGTIPHYFDGCNTWLTKQIATIRSLHPKLVLLGERTTLVGHADKTPFTSAAWHDGLVRTITRLKTPTTRVAIFEDLFWGNNLPGPCLSMNLKSVQRCATSYTNPTVTGHQVAERKAARDTNTTFIPTHQWFCTTKTCSPVIGDYIPKRDQTHVSASYAQYLTTVIETALKPLL
ncbi:MAG: hypothetical protein EBR99_04450 [Actinobacteria bacterium]|nr:hypothetical protein [Actinomycetota bacterium]